MDSDALAGAILLAYFVAGGLWSGLLNPRTWLAHALPDNMDRAYIWLAGLVVLVAVLSISGIPLRPAPSLEMVDDRR